MNCYLCEKSNLKIIRTRLRYGIKRNVLQCQNCGIVYLEPQKENLVEFYKKDYRKLYTPVIGEVLNSKESFDIYLPFQQARLDLIKEILNPEMRALDIGCSSGHFLYTLKRHVREVIGIEFNEENAKFVNEVLGINVYTSSIENTDIPLEHFDLITVFQVLEHIDEPINFLEAISKYLKPNGFLYIEVPNINDALISLYCVESYCDFWFIEPHIFYYSLQTLSLLLKKAGFKGSVKTIQSYNFMNHINWIFVGAPQKSVGIGMSKPVLIPCNSPIGIEDEIKNTLNTFIQKVDGEYKAILEKYNMGNSIIFIGKKSSNVGRY